MRKRCGLENRKFVAEKTLRRTGVRDSPPMNRLLDAVARVGPKDITVLVRGETGTGKELISGLVHPVDEQAQQAGLRAAQRVPDPSNRESPSQPPHGTSAVIPANGRRILCQAGLDLPYPHVQDRDSL